MPVRQQGEWIDRLVVANGFYIPLADDLLAAIRLGRFLVDGLVAPVGLGRFLVDGLVTSIGLGGVLFGRLVMTTGFDPMLAANVVMPVELGFVPGTVLGRSVATASRRLVLFGHTTVLRLAVRVLFGGVTILGPPMPLQRRMFLGAVGLVRGRGLALTGLRVMCDRNVAGRADCSVMARGRRRTEVREGRWRRRYSSRGRR